jgi:lambda repressor-like predicted transcriptional regulator
MSATAGGDTPQMVRNGRALNAVGRVHGGDRWAGRIKVPRSAHPIVRDLIRAMNMQMVSFANLSKETGVSADTMQGWRTRYVPRLDNIEAALNGVGLRLAILPLEDDKP